MILSKEHELMRKNFRNFAETEFKQKFRSSKTEKVDLTGTSGKRLQNMVLQEQKSR